MWGFGSFYVPYGKQLEQWQHSCLPSFNLDRCIRHGYEDLCTRFKYLPHDVPYYSCTRSILLMAEIGVFCRYLLIPDQQLDLNILFPTHCCDCFWGEGVTSIMELCAKGLTINFVGSYYTLICQCLSICSSTWVLHSAKIEDYVSPNGKKRRKNENGACWMEMKKENPWNQSTPLHSNCIEKKWLATSLVISSSFISLHITSSWKP